VKGIPAFDQMSSGRVRAGAVIDVPEALRVEKIGGAGRNIGKGDEAAGARDAFGDRWHAQGAARGGTHLRSERRIADVAHGDPPVLDQSHPVAVQAVTSGTATGCDRRGGGAGRGGKDRPVIIAPKAPAGDLAKDGSERWRHPTLPQCIAANKDGAAG